MNNEQRSNQYPFDRKAFNLQLKKINSNKQTLLWGIISLFVVSIIDILTPPEYVFNGLYLCCILIVFKQRPMAIIGFSIVSALIILTNVLFFDHLFKLTLVAWMNRAVALVALAITSILALLYRWQMQKDSLKDQQQIANLEKMLFMVSHQVRKPVANVIGLSEIIKTSDELSTGELKLIINSLSTAVEEMDNYIRDLDKFMNNTAADRLQ